MRDVFDFIISMAASPLVFIAYPLGWLWGAVKGAFNCGQEDECHWENKSSGRLARDRATRAVQEGE